MQSYAPPEAQFELQSVDFVGELALLYENVAFERDGKAFPLKERT
ncbi:MAG: hypothetical protein WBD47_12470 [Phormidesmis sp.]